MATFTVQIKSNLVITKVVEVEADSHEDAVGDAFDLALASDEGWNIETTFEALTEDNLEVSSITPDEPEEEEEEWVDATEADLAEDMAEAAKV